MGEEEEDWLEISTGGGEKEYIRKKLVSGNLASHALKKGGGGGVPPSINVFGGRERGGKRGRGKIRFVHLAKAQEKKRRERV